jgi:uncharacterized protein involved in type VI secretion and phage assembly
MRDKTGGVVIAKVIDVNDPEKAGRIRVRYPWLDDTHTEWAPVASIMAGPDRGCFVMPEVDDEALVAFELGDWDHPIVVGFLWNQAQQPPSTDPRQRMIRSVNGHTIRLVDSTPTGGNKGAIVIEDAHGNVITLTNGLISIHSEMHIEVSAKSVKIMGRPVRPVGGPI